MRQRRLATGRAVRPWVGVAGVVAACFFFLLAYRFGCGLLHLDRATGTLHGRARSRPAPWRDRCMATWPPPGGGGSPFWPVAAVHEPRAGGRGGAPAPTDPTDLFRPDGPPASLRDASSPGVAASLSAARHRALRARARALAGGLSQICRSILGVRVLQARPTGYGVTRQGFRRRARFLPRRVIRRRRWAPIGRVVGRHHVVSEDLKHEAKFCFWRELGCSLRSQRSSRINRRRRRATPAARHEVPRCGDASCHGG